MRAILCESGLTLGKRSLSCLRPNEWKVDAGKQPFSRLSNSSAMLLLKATIADRGGITFTQATVVVVLPDPAFASTAKDPIFSFCFAAWIRSAIAICSAVGFLIKILAIVFFLIALCDCFDFF